MSSSTTLTNEANAGRTISDDISAISHDISATSDYISATSEDISTVSDNISASQVVSTVYAEDNATNSHDHVDELLDQLGAFAFVQYVMITVFLVGIIGNGLVIYVTVKNKRMRTVTNLLLLNLALTDIIFLSVSSAYSFRLLIVGFKGDYEDQLCDLIDFSIACCTVVTAYTLLAVSIARYIGIVHPQRAKTLVTLRKVTWLIVFLWVAGVVVCIPKLMFVSCRINGTFTKKELLFLRMYFVFSYLIPLIAITVFSVLAFRVLQKPSIAANQKSDDNKRRSSRMVVIVCVAFAVCFLPTNAQHTIPVYDYVSSSTYAQISFVSVIFFTLNSVINPIIYSFASQEFRARFWDVIYIFRCTRRPEHPNGVDCLMGRACLCFRSLVTVSSRR